MPFAFASVLSLQDYFKKRIDDDDEDERHSQQRVDGELKEEMPLRAKKSRNAHRRKKKFNFAEETFRDC